MDKPESLEEFLIATIAETCSFERSALTLETSLVDIGIDSLNMTAVLARIELVYDCQLKEEQVIEVLQADRIADVVQLVRDFTADTTPAVAASV